MNLLDRVNIIRELVPGLIPNTSSSLHNKMLVIFQKFSKRIISRIFAGKSGILLLLFIFENNVTRTVSFEKTTFSFAIEYSSNVRYWSTTINYSRFSCVVSMWYISSQRVCLIAIRICFPRTIIIVIGILYFVRYLLYLKSLNFLFV